MDLARPTLKDVILPRLEDARDLRLHALTCVEESTHGIDKVIKLFKLLHQLFFGQELDSFLDVASLRILFFIICDINDFNECFKVEHAADVAIHKTRDALNLVTEIG